MVAFMCKGEQRAFCLDAVDFLGEKRFQLAHGQGCAVDDLTGLQRESAFQHGPFSVLAHVDDVHGRGVRHRHTLFRSVKVAFGHAGHAGQAV